MMRWIDFHRKQDKKRKFYTDRTILNEQEEEFYI